MGSLAKMIAVTMIMKSELSNILIRQYWEHNRQAWGALKHYFDHHVSCGHNFLQHKKQPFNAFFWEKTSKFKTFKHQVAFFWPESLTLV